MVIAIKGHPTRGKEVIEILEMLGGENPDKYRGDDVNWYYYIDDNYRFIDWCNECTANSDFVSCTLEEFLEKFPYKVGDKVKLDKWPCTITKMSWEYDDIIYYVQGADFSKGVYSKDKDLQPYKEETYKEETYKEETMEGKIKNFEILESNCSNEIKIEFDPSKFEMVERENGYYVVRKKPQYPKTYGECCKILNHLSDDDYVGGYKDDLLEQFQKLLICREAYWKIAGEEMGLGKPWKPDWADNYQKKWLITFYQSEINFTSGSNVQFVLAFPTEEMRNIFYENFKKLIELCRELL